MLSWSFREDLVLQLAEARTEASTLFMQACTQLGEIEGYMLVVVLLFALYSKRLAIQSSIVVLLAMTLNHLLKILIQNPRPFVNAESYLEHWAVSADKANELVAEFSTPSGHAMAAASLYTFLILKVPNRTFQIVCTAAIVLTGVSRPYIGVHFIEDILIGWVIGIAIGYFGARQADAISSWWYTDSWTRHLAVVLGCSVVVWTVTLLILDRPIGGMPLPFISYLGLLSGLLVAAPIEQKTTHYEPSNKSLMASSSRVLIMGGILVGTMVGLEVLFENIQSDESLGGHILRYVRYALVASGVLIAPYVFRRLGL